MQNYKKFIGKSYLHNGIGCIIRDMYDRNGYLEVITNLKVHRIEKSNFKNEFLPVEEENPQNSSALALYLGADKDAASMTSLSDVLMKNIEKVNQDAGFIEQARAVNETAKTLIELHRAKIELIQTLR